MITFYVYLDPIPSLSSGNGDRGYRSIGTESGVKE